jgi:hypothetical protein
MQTASDDSAETRGELGKFYGHSSDHSPLLATKFGKKGYFSKSQWRMLGTVAVSES